MCFVPVPGVVEQSLTEVIYFSVCTQVQIPVFRQRAENYSLNLWFKFHGSFMKLAWLSESTIAKHSKNKVQDKFCGLGLFSSSFHTPCACSEPAVRSLASGETKVVFYKVSDSKEMWPVGLWGLLCLFSFFFSQPLSPSCLMAGIYCRALTSALLAQAQPGVTL